MSLFLFTEVGLLVKNSLHCQAMYNAQTQEPCLTPCWGNHWVAAVFDRLNRAGIAIHTFDCLGHGKSEPTDKRSRAYFDRYEDLVSPSAADVSHD